MSIPEKLRTELQDWRLRGYRCRRTTDSIEITRKGEFIALVPCGSAKKRLGRDGTKTWARISQAIAVEDILRRYTSSDK